MVTAARVGLADAELNVSALDRDRLLGTHPHRFFELGPYVFARAFVEDVQEVVVAYFEHLGQDPHAHGVALAKVEVDYHFHVGSLVTVRGRQPTSAVIASYAETGDGSRRYVLGS